MGLRIKTARQRRSWSTYQLAERVGVRQGAIVHWESGTRVPRWPELRRLAGQLDVQAHWIIEPLIDEFVPPGEDT